jgi:hypothetical protein
LLTVQRGCASVAGSGGVLQVYGLLGGGGVQDCGGASCMMGSVVSTIGPYSVQGLLPDVNPGHE